MPSLVESTDVRLRGPDPAGTAVHGLVILTSVTQYALLALLPMLTARLGLTPATLSVLLALPSMLMIVSAMPVGRLCDRWGPERVTTAAAALLAVSCALQAMPSLVPFTAGRLIFGLALTGVWTGGPAWLRASADCDADTSRVGAIVTSAAIGSIAGPIVAGVMADRLGVSWPFAVVAAAAALFALPLLRRSTPQVNPSADAGTSGAGTATSWTALLHGLLRSREVLAALAGMVAVGAANGAIQLLVPLQLGRAGASASSIGLILAIAGAVYAVASSMTSRTRERRVTERTAVACCLVMGALIAPAALDADSVCLLAVCLVAFTLPRAQLNTLGYRLAARSNVAAAGNAGVVVGVMNLMWAAAMSIGPIAAAWLTRIDGAGAAFAGSAATTVAIGILLAAMLIIQRQMRDARQLRMEVR
jgi:predicted MFS family arabinose efflux permease